MSNFVKLTVDVLSVGDVVSLVSDASTGAIAIFVGTTRDNFNGKKVLRLVSELSFCIFEIIFTILEKHGSSNLFLPQSLLLQGVHW